jgi:hypothetical protein
MAVLIWFLAMASCKTFLTWSGWQLVCIHLFMSSIVEIENQLMELSNTKEVPITFRISRESPGIIEVDVHKAQPTGCGVKLARLSSLI